MAVMAMPRTVLRKMTRMSRTRVVLAAVERVALYMIWVIAKLPSQTLLQKKQDVLCKIDSELMARMCICGR